MTLDAQSQGTASFTASSDTSSHSMEDEDTVVRLEDMAIMPARASQRSTSTTRASKLTSTLSFACVWRG